jgi:hypothetical protein
MGLDWGEIEKSNAKKYKNYATPGIYKVKCVDVEIHEVGKNGSIAQDFMFEGEDYKFPKATHWLTFKEGKAGWRQYHNRQLMVLFGQPKETAEKVIDKIEAMTDKKKISEAYEAAYKHVLKNNPEVEIEVYPDGEYTRSEFTDRTVAMPHTSAKPAAEDDVAPTEIEEDGELDLSSLPF